LEFEHIANCSYDMADAMMKAREKNETWRAIWFSG
jgi:hypothetical protein